MARPHEYFMARPHEYFMARPHEYLMARPHEYLMARSHEYLMILEIPMQASKQMVTQLLMLGTSRNLHAYRYCYGNKIRW